jgi:hypothetical protein
VIRDGDGVQMYNVNRHSSIPEFVFIKLYYTYTLITNPLRDACKQTNKHLEGEFLNTLRFFLHHKATPDFNDPCHATVKIPTRETK